MEIRFSNLNASDLRYSTPADLLVNIEADLEVVDGDDVLYSERAFPVAELARDLMRWKNSRIIPPDDFAFNSMSFDELGAIKISREGSGWFVSSVFASGRKSQPVPWGELVRELDEFIQRVEVSIQSIGIDPNVVFYSS